MNSKSEIAAAEAEKLLRRLHKVHRQLKRASDLAEQIHRTEDTTAVFLLMRMRLDAYARLIATEVDNICNHRHERKAQSVGIVIKGPQT